MKGKDYLYLARISLKANKRKRITMIFSLTSSLSFLIPVFFLLFSFYLGAIAEFNSTKAVSSIMLSNIDLKDGAYQKIENLSNVEERLTYEEYLLSNNAYFLEDKIIKHTDTYLYIENQEINLEYQDLPKKIASLSRKNMFYGLATTCTDYFKAFDIEYPLFLNSEKQYFQQMNYGELYTGDVIQAEDEVMISSESLKILGIKEEDILGKKISYKTKFRGESLVCNQEGKLLHKDVEQNVNGEFFYVFRDLKVVGIFNSNIHKCPTRSYNPPSTEEERGFWYEKGLEFWFSKEALIENGKRCVPNYFDYKEQDTIRKAYQYDISPVEYSEQLVQKGKIYLPYGFNLMGRYGNIYYEEMLQDIIQFKDFKSAYQANEIVKENLKLENATILNDTLNDYVKIYPFITYLSIVFVIIGGIFFLIMLLNLMNTFQYFIRSKRRYIGIQKAMGLKNYEVRRLYYFEMLYIGIKSCLYSLIISLGCCIFISVYFKSSTQYIKEGFLPELIDLSLGYYPLAYGLIVVFVFGIMVLMNLVLCKKVSNQNIIDLLKE